MGEFEKSVKIDATPSAHLQDDGQYYDDDPDDGIDILQKEIRKFDDKVGRNQRKEKKRRTNHVGNENDAHIDQMIQQVKKTARSYEDKHAAKNWRNRFNRLYGEN